MALAGATVNKFCPVPETSLYLRKKARMDIAVSIGAYRGAVEAGLVDEEI